MTGQAPLLTTSLSRLCLARPHWLKVTRRLRKEKQAETEKCLKSLARGGECRKVSKDKREEKSRVKGEVKNGDHRP